MPVFQAPDADPDTANRILSTLLEASPLAIVAFDPEGVVTLWNPAAERIFGWTAEEAIGKSLPFVPAEKQEEFRALRQRALCGESSTGMELQRRRADGSPIAVSVSTAPLRLEDGTICGILSILTDVTGLRMMEEQLRHARKMEAVGRLAGGVTNDFNNLLTAISGYCDLLLHRLPDYSALRRDVEEIRKAGDRAAALTRKLLDFGSGQVPQPEAADLNSIVTGMERMLRRRVGEDIELATELCPDLGHAKADPGQVEQVIENLVENARKAMPEGGRLTVATGNVDLSPAYAATHTEVTPGPYVLLSVEDTGHGTEDETQSRLFEPFRTAEGNGTGLGLATVCGIVRQSGGHIRVDSAPGRGSVIKVYLPRVTSPSCAHRDADLPLPKWASPGTETVLLVEDEDTVRSLAREILGMNGYTVLEARHGHEALLISEAHRGPIHLMLTDVVMPEMNGRELADRLHPLRPGTRVLYMSGYTDNALGLRGVLEERIAFLQKPFTPEILSRKIREVLDAP